MSWGKRFANIQIGQPTQLNPCWPKHTLQVILCLMLTPEPEAYSVLYRTKPPARLSGQSTLVRGLLPAF